MSTTHISRSLFMDLFRHNLVSPDGRVKATTDDLRKYSSFLIRQSKDRVRERHVHRKRLVDDARVLLRFEERQEKELKKILNQLDLEKGTGETLRAKGSKKPKERCLGPPEAKQTEFDRRVMAESERAKVLKRDMNLLDDWLKCINDLPVSERQDVAVDWNEVERTSRDRKRRHWREMENARLKLVQREYDDYDKALMKILNQGAISKHKSNKRENKKTQDNSAKKCDADGHSGKNRRGAEYSNTDVEDGSRGNNAEDEFEDGVGFRKDTTAKQDDAAAEVVDGVEDTKDTAVAEAVLNNVDLIEIRDYAEDVDDKTASVNHSDSYGRTLEREIAASYNIVEAGGSVESDDTTDTQKDTVDVVAAIQDAAVMNETAGPRY